MTRTDAQVAVDEALRLAVQDWLKAYGYTSGLLTDFLILGALQGFDDDGDPTCSTFVSHAEAFIPYYRVRGLVHAAAQQLDDMAFTRDEDDD